MLLRCLVMLLIAAGCALAQGRATFTLAGDWEVRVEAPGIEPQTIHIAPPEMIQVTAEKYTAVPIFNPKAGGWIKGAQLRGVKTMETTCPGLLDPASFVLRAGPEPDAQVFTKGVDYEADLSWGTFGRLAGGAIQPEQTVYATYRHSVRRLDVVMLRGGRVVVSRGPGDLRANEFPIGNIYVPGNIAKLEADDLFPILKEKYLPSPMESATVARLIKRLNAGGPLRILAWGDSVTDGAYLTDKQQRWQEQFVARLRERFPKAQIDLLTQAWGGRNTATYLAEPPGSPHNYRETVLGVKPDLIISEFVNDAGLKPAQVEERYSKLLADFKEIGAEWIILTPHYVRPDWMNLTREREIDDDPRPYVAGLREFAAKHDVALADASLRWGQLWRQGIPYTIWLVNSINHPNAQGMKLFADALMSLF